MPPVTLYQLCRAKAMCAVELELSQLVVTDPLTPQKRDDCDVEQTQTLIAPGSEPSETAYRIDRRDSPLITSSLLEEGSMEAGVQREVSSLPILVESGKPETNLKPAEQVANQLKKIEAEKELEVVWYKQPQVQLRPRYFPA